MIEETFCCSESITREQLIPPVRHFEWPTGPVLHYVNVRSPLRSAAQTAGTLPNLNNRLFELSKHTLLFPQSE